MKATRANYWDPHSGSMILMQGTTVVHEPDNAPRPTGILNANGIPLYRTNPTIKVGFQKD